MIRTIKTHPQNDRDLRQPSVLLTAADWESPYFPDLVVDLVATMKTAEGVGLAAPQIGLNLRLIAIGEEATKTDLNSGLATSGDLVIINPSWEKLSRKKIKDLEGCLSVPGLYGEVKRYQKIAVRGRDIQGRELEFVAQDFLARVIQHECDHLDGVLFIDKAKNIFNR